MVHTVTSYERFIKAFFIFYVSYGFTLHTQMHFHSPIKASKFCPATIFAKLTDVEHRYIQISFTETEPNRRINLESMERNFFKP
jgi:hypothetical protein